MSVHCRVHFNTYFFLRNKLPISMKMLVFFLSGCVRNTVKTMVVEIKKKSTSSTIFGVATAAKSCELKRCADRVRTEPTRQIWTFHLNFIASFFRLNWTFPLPPKRQLSTVLNFLFINKFAFEFCCLCLFCYNVGQHAISRQNHTEFSTGLYPVYEVYWWPCGADVRTVTCLLRHYQNFLAW